jgi:mRNA interferase MazF
MQLTRGTVLLINLNPTKGSETGKIRPCVIVTNDFYNEKTPIIQVVPLTAWNEKKAMIITNIVIETSEQNGLTKTSIADCLQTRPIDYKERVVRILGKLSEETMNKIDIALKIIFDLK